MRKRVFSRQNPNIKFRDFKNIWQTVISNEVYFGPQIEKFESTLSEYIGTKYVTLVNMGRTAELVALEALEFSKGDEIIMPSYNYPIVPTVVKMLGLKPVFVDVDPDTFNIDTNLIEKAITSKTKAIFVTHMCGQPCQMEEIIRIKNKHGLKLIEDAVHALGAEYNNKKVGTFGDISYFSFYTGKTMTTFMGAAICTNNKSISEKVKRIVEGYKKLSFRRLQKAIDYGVVTYFLTKPFVFSFTVYPILLILNMFNSQLLDDKMSEPLLIPEQLPAYYLTQFTNIQAAMGLSQHKRLDSSIAKRIENSCILSKNIKPNPLISVPAVGGEAKHAFLYYFIGAKNRNQFRKKLIFKGVDTKRDANLACSHLDIFKDEYKYCPVSDKLSKQNILIPNYPSLSEKDILYIADAINQTVKEVS